MFLNKTLQRIWIYHHLQFLISSKDSKNLEKSLCEGERAETYQCIPSQGTAQEHFQRSLSEHSSPYNPKMQVKAPSCKEEAIYDTETRLTVFFGHKVHLKWSKTVLWSDEQEFDIVWKAWRTVFRNKEERDLQPCYQHSVQKPASLTVCGCISSYGMGSWHIWKGTINAAR